MPTVTNTQVTVSVVFPSIAQGGDEKEAMRQEQECTTV